VIVFVLAGSGERAASAAQIYRAANSTLGSDFPRAPQTLCDGRVRVRERCRGHSYGFVFRGAGIGVGWMGDLRAFGKTLTAYMLVEYVCTPRRTR
jgi:hypothetical protein